MTIPDELQRLWQAQTGTLADDLARTQSLLLRQQRDRVDAPLRRYVRGVVAVLALAIVGLFCLLPVVVARSLEPLYLLVGGAAVGFLAATAWRSADLLRQRQAIAVEGPVAATQAALARLQIGEFRLVRLLLLGGVALWLPLPVLLLEALGGPALLPRLPRLWLIANLGFGALVLGAGLLWCRRRIDGPVPSAWARRLVDACLPRSLRAAADEARALAELARDEGGEPSDRDES